MNLNTRSAGLPLLALLVAVLFCAGPSTLAAQLQPNRYRAFVLVDVDGDGIKTCPLTEAKSLIVPGGPTAVETWICAGEDDALLLAANPGRPPQIVDLLGLKAGPENGLEFLAKFGARRDDVRTDVTKADPWFAYLVLWSDGNRDTQISEAELTGFAYAGFDRIVLSGNPEHRYQRATAIRAGRPHEIISVRFVQR